MSLFGNIFGTPHMPRTDATTGSRRTVLSSGKDAVVLSKGEVIKGEVTDLRSNEVTLRLEDGTYLHAKFHGASELSIGQEAEFFVQENNDVLITLKLLTDGDTSFTESAIDKALEAAGFPKSEHSAELVRALLSAGLPANKEMIQKMMQASASNKNVELSTLTALLKNNLPVTKENASTLQSYRNFEHRLVGQAATLTAGIAEAIQAGDTSPAFVKELLARFFGEDATGSNAPLSNTVTASATPAPVLPEQVTSFSNTAGITMPSFTEVPTEAKTFLQQAGDVSNALSSLLTAGDALLGSDEAPVSSDIRLATADTGSFSGTRPLKEVLTPEQLQQLHRILSETDTGSQLSQILNNDLTFNNITTNQLFTAFSGFTSPDSLKELSSLLKEEPLLSSLLKDALLEQFTLTPEELTKEDAIKDFYARTNKHLSDLLELTSSAQSESLKSVASTAGKMQDNLQFMNTLNQLFPYVQLPLKFTEQLTHGELYVYTKKKDLSDRTKEVSILLHLDMDSLGPTDVHLSLLGQNVSAKFYLNDADSQAAVSEELPSLTEALQKKGYSLNAQVMQREKDPDIVNDFMNGGGTVSMKRFRFDIRA